MVQLAGADSQWIFTPEELEHTPSRQDDIDLDAELKSRKETIVFMRRVAQFAHPELFSDSKEWRTRGFLSVGATMIHRFFMRRSVKDFGTQIMAATVLFLASKVDEEPIKLRYIVNAILRLRAETKHVWDPDNKKEPHLARQSIPYQQWEREILITEEIILDTLCFDMALQHPWAILRHATKSFNSLLEGPATDWRAAANGSRTPGAETAAKKEEDVPKRRTKLSKKLLRDMGWGYTYQGLLSPIPVLAPAPIFACAMFVLTVAAVDQIPPSQAYAVAGELGSKFGLDLQFDEGEGAIGADLQAVRNCVDQYLQYAKSGLTSSLLASGLPEDVASSTYNRRFT